MRYRVATSRLLLALALALSLQAPVFAETVEWLELPPGIAGETPWLRRDGDALWLSWVTRQDNEFSLRASRFDGEHWQDPVTVTSGENWFNTAADFARVLPLGDGALLAVWLEFTLFRDFYYRFSAALSLDGGAGWHDVGSPPGIEDYGYHGFVSAFGEDDAYVLFWISGFRDDAALWRARLDKDGRWSAVEQIDERVCNCCLTATARSGTLVYRDRGPDEIRDIALKKAGAAASAGQTLHADGWRIAACPNNGPAIAETRQRRAVAWFTNAQDSARTRVAIMPIEAAKASHLVTAADGRSRGQADVAWLGDSRLALSTLTRDNGIEIGLIEVSDSAAGVQTKIAVPGTGGAGQPTLAYFGGSLFIAFYDHDASRIRFARIDPGL